MLLLYMLDTAETAGEKERERGRERERERERERDRGERGGEGELYTVLYIVGVTQ